MMENVAATVKFRLKWMVLERIVIFVSQVKFKPSLRLMLYLWIIDDTFECLLLTLSSKISENIEIGLCAC